MEFLIKTLILGINLPDYISNELESFIFLCLNLDSKNLNPSVKDIKNHTFLKDCLKE